MTYTVWVLTPRGVETYREDLTAEVAEAITRHPSLHGVTTVVLPSFAEAPEVGR